MKSPETLEEFYQRTQLPQTGIFTKKHGHFNIYSREHCKQVTPYNRRDFYKISFILGTGILHYADKSIHINRPALVFSNPMIPSAWEPVSKEQGGYFCIFTEEFIQSYNQSDILHESSLYKPGGNPVYFINEEQETDISDIFLKMQQEMQSEYGCKFSLLYNYIQILIHEALKLRPPDTYIRHNNASQRITSLFMELLERQFPVDTNQQGILLKSAADYAAQMSVHVNHLNRAVKEVTGKTTSAHISDRIIQEAKANLLNTNLNISEVAYALGFEYPSYFNNFFRKQTNITPRKFREEKLHLKVDE